MSRSWCTTLEEALISEYVERITRKKAKPPKSPYMVPSANKRSGGHVNRPNGVNHVSNRPHVNIGPSVNVRDAAGPPLSPTTAPTKKKSARSVKLRPGSPYAIRKSGSTSSIKSTDSHGSSKLSVYSADVRASGQATKCYTGKKIIKRVKLFQDNDSQRYLISSSFTDLLDRARVSQLFTSDGTQLMPHIYPILPHNCHLFSYDPITRFKKNRMKPKVTWTKDGVQVAGAREKKTTKVELSERMTKLANKTKSRVLVFKNGEYKTNNIQISENKMTAMLQDASDALLFTVSNLYTVEGTKLMEDEPVPHILKSSYLRGPLWATKGGDNFSFVGAYNWCRSQLKHLRASNQKLQLAYNESGEEHKKIQLKEKMEVNKEDIADLREIVKNISEDVLEEQDEGHEFRLKNMPSIDDSSRLIGRQNVRVNVYVNKRDIEPKVAVIPGGTFKASLHWLIEECEKIHRADLGVTTLKANRLYDATGNVIKALKDISPDDDIYLSYGEPFAKPVIHYYLDIKFYGATAHSLPEEADYFVTRRGLENDEMREEIRSFSVVQGIPSEKYKPSQALMNLNKNTLKFTLADMKSKHISEDNVFLHHKNFSQRLVYPSLFPNTKYTALQSGLQLNSQVWVYTSEYKLKPKMFPSLSLTISNRKVTMKDGTEEVQGLVVALGKGHVTRWRATIEGEFCCPETGLFLTGVQENPGELVVEEEGEGVKISTVPIGEEVHLAAMPPFQRSPGFQRWAFRQQAISMLGQWKLCEIENPVWKEQCLSWPVHQDGTVNDKLAWPIEGLLRMRAPPLKPAASRSSPFQLGNKVSAPLRLVAHRCGSIGKGKYVTAPDLTNMKKDLAMKHKTFKYQPDTMKWLEKHTKDIAKEDRDKVSDLELRLFLDKCQGVLGLLKPPTRLFTKDGMEVTSLGNLARDQDVYVTCGGDFEPLDGEKVSRDKLLHNINSDINKLKTFCSFLVPSTYCLSVPTAERGTLARLQILVEPDLETLLDTESITDILDIANRNKSIEEPDPVVVQAPAIVEQRSHLQSHIDQNNQDLAMVEEFPWRNPAFTSGLIKNKLDWANSSDEAASDTESECESLKSFKSNSSCSSVRSSCMDLSYDQWVYKECRFCLVDNPSLVLAYDVSNNVKLVPYNKASVEQCWTMDERFVYASNGLVLTVTECSVTPPAPVDYTGSRVKVAPLQDTQHGNTHQKWVYDEVTGHLLALSGSRLCRSLTSALLAKICTYGVTGSDNVEQPTFLMENRGVAGIPADNTHVYVCGSCATALRDRHTVEKIEPTSFVCAIGYYAATNQLRIKASLLALAGIEGLEPDKAFGTLYLWESILADIREQRSVKAIRDVVKQTMFLECANEGLILVRCYLNGKFPPKHRGVLFLAKSFQEILRKALLELKPGRPLSRLFYADGTEVLDFYSLLASGEDAGSSPDSSTIVSGNACYRELFVSTGDDFIHPQNLQSRTLKLKKRMRLYRQLKKSDLRDVHRSKSGRRPPAALPRGRADRTMPVFVTRNGDFTGPAVRIVSSSLEGVLEGATKRLNLTIAARRIFRSDGVEVVSWGDVERSAALVISTGEPFIQRNRPNSRTRRKT